MKARLITRFKDVTPDGGVIEWVPRRVPEPLRPSGLGFKYRAAYAIDAVPSDMRSTAPHPLAA